MQGRKSPAVTGPGERPAPSPRKGASTAQRSPNSRPGNIANLRHGAYRARQARDRFRRAAVKDWTAILAERGLGSDRLARAVAREAAFLLGVRLRIEAFLSSRGFFRRDGEIKSAAAKAIELSAGLLDRAARLLERLTETGPAQTGDVIYRCEIVRRPPRAHVPEQEAAPLAAGAVQETRSTPATTPPPTVPEIAQPEPPAASRAQVAPEPAAPVEAPATEPIARTPEVIAEEIRGYVRRGMRG